MKKTSKIIVTVISIICLTLTFGITVFADNPYLEGTLSRNLYDKYFKDGEYAKVKVDETILFDSEDLITISNNVESGKTILAQTIDDFTNRSTGFMDDGVTPIKTSLSESVQTFETLNNSIANVYKAGHEEGYNKGVADTLPQNLGTNVVIEQHYHTNDCYQNTQTQITGSISTYTYENNGSTYYCWKCNNCEAGSSTNFGWDYLHAPTSPHICGYKTTKTLICGYAQGEITSIKINGKEYTQE